MATEEEPLRPPRRGRTPKPMLPPESAAEACAAGAVDVNGAEEFTGVSRMELYRAMSAGEIEWFYHGRIRLIARKELARKLEAARAKRASHP